MWLSRSDVHYTLRQMSRKPGFVLLAALVLAGGLAVSLIAFTICYTAFYRPLPITNGERIVHVCPFPHGRECGPLRADDFSRIRGDITSLENLGIYTERAASVEYGGEAWRMAAVATEWNLFRLSQTEALIGRTLQAIDHASEAEAVAVIGYDLWQRRFAGDPDVVGTVVSIDRQPVRIVGVMPEGYAMPWSAQLWLPISPTVLAPLASAPIPLVETYALLEPGVSMEQASQEITQLMARNREQFPADPFAEYPRPYLRIINGMTTGHVGSFQTAMVDDIGLVITIGIMNTLTLLVFLLACINVGTLLLARINERMKDTSIRVALGAPRMRVLTQMCLESTFVTLLGAALAVLLAGMGLEVLMLAARMLNDSLLPFWMDFHVDASTLSAVVLYVLLAIGLTAVLPGWRVVNGNFNATMRDGTRGALGLRPGRFSRGLVVVALMIVTLLLYLVTLLGSTVIPITNMLTRIPDNLISGGIVLDTQRYSEQERQQFVRTLTTRMANEPSIAFGNVVVNLGDVGVEAEEGAAAGDRVRAALSSQNVPRAGEVDPDFAARVDDSLEVRLLEGRMFTDADTASSEPVVTISRNLAERLWPEQSAVGERLRIVGVLGIAEDWRRVVGVTSDSTAASFTTEIRPVNLTLVLPLPQIDTSERLFSVTAFASSDAAKSRAMQFLRDEFAAAETSVEPFVQDPETLVSSVTGAFRVGMRLALLVGLFVLMVAMAGIYGLTQNSVLMATHEIGVRRALGARDGLITKTFMKRTGRQVLTGFIAAMLFCAPVTLLFYMLSQEFGLDVPFSLAMSAIVILLLYAAVMLATYLPVRRILRLEPGDALRYE